jgi:hypothetical protein
VASLLKPNRTGCSRSSVAPSWTRPRSYLLTSRRCYDPEQPVTEKYAERSARVVAPITENVVINATREHKSQEHHHKAGDNQPSEGKCG